MGNEASHQHTSQYPAARRPDAGGSSDLGASTSAPGAFKMDSAPRTQRFYVTIPNGVRPGQHFAVLVNGQQMMVRCPDGNKPGDRLIVAAPRRQPQQYVVEIPSTVQPGQQFRVNINDQQVVVTCPPGVRPGQRVTFQLPSREEAAPEPKTTQAPLPDYQMFEVVVPNGVEPGQSFALMAGGQKVMVTCPPNVRSGQKIRFQLPVQLSQQQIEAFKVDYDKDGWMRCLGTDLKFHWVYNTAKDQGEIDSAKSRYNIEASAFVRELVLVPSGGIDIRLVKAEDYAMNTTVPGTQINYKMLSSIAQLPYIQKVDWLRSQFDMLRTPWEQGHIKLKVRRQSLLQDTVDGFMQIDRSDMLKIFRIEFIGEPGLDAGGVSREWYQLISEAIFNPDHGLFLYSSINQMCMQVNPNSGIANEHHLRYYNLLGRVLGKSLMDGQITPVHLVQPIYKHMMGWPVTLHDLECLDDMVYRNLIGMRDMSDISALFLEFNVTEDHLGSTVNIDLVPGGSDILVTDDNLPAYLEAQLRYRLVDRTKSQLAELLKGFYEVVPEPLLSVFDFQELELLLHGLPVIDMDDWIKNTDYTGDLHGQPNNKVVQWFWETVRDFDDEKKAKLLQFVTGTSGVPSKGFAYLQGNDANIRRFTVHGDKSLTVFPRSHTCFNRIDMPMYRTKADLQKYLTLAISTECSGFGIE